MNRNIAFAFVLATAAIGSAFAGEITPEPASFTSSASRAQVQAELAQYRRAGIDTSSYEYNPLTQFKSATTRAQVTAEYLANRDQVAAASGEGSGAETFARNINVNRQDATRLAGLPVNAQ
ncbi:MAG: hypothetical protein JWP43_2913 [Ramlibacter sp.]|nr:hypothetical protein [Ramlibacter sp.]